MTDREERQCKWLWLYFQAAKRAAKAKRCAAEAVGYWRAKAVHYMAQASSLKADYHEWNERTV